jgi:type I restriction enzyme S subunit
MAKYKPYEKYKDSGVEWIGQVPEHWAIDKIRRLCTLVTGNTPPKSEEENYLDGVFEWVKPDNIHEDGTISESAEKLSHIGIQKARLVPKGSALVCCIGTVGKVGIASQDLTTNQQINSAVFDSLDLWLSRFGFYSIKSAENEHQRYSNKVVVAILNKNSQGNILMPVPPLHEQQTIANFLDHKTSEVDNLIADKEKLITLLQEYRQSVISEAVTKGLNPDVKMKDSGIEWIGEIPEHWETLKAKHLFYLVTELSTSGEEDLLSVSEYYGVARRADKLEDGDFLTRAVSLKGYKKCKKFDIVMNIMLAWKKGLGTSLYDGIVSPSYCVYRPRKEDATDTMYFHYLFRTSLYAQLFKQHSTGIIDSRLRLYPDMFLNLFVHVPPYKEQQAIADYLDKKTSEIDTLISGVQDSISQLKTYRQSLISEAVTGKIDVREFETKGVDTSA